MSWFSKEPKVCDSVKEQWELDRQARAKKKADNDPAALAKADRLTRGHLRPQVWWSR